MVFYCRCWYARDMIYELDGQPNTQGDNFHSDPPDSDTRPPIPQSIRNEWSDSDTPTPNVRSSSLRVFHTFEASESHFKF